MKGFKKDGKFRPTEKKSKSSVKKSDVRKKTQIEKTSGQDLKQRKMHTVKNIWTYDEADDDLKEKIIEKLRQMRFDSMDDFFAQDEGVIYDEKSNKDGEEIGFRRSSLYPKYYDLDRENYIQFELELEDEKKFAKYLGIPESLRKKISFNFVNNQGSGIHSGRNTELIIDDPTGDEIDTNSEFDEVQYKEQKEEGAYKDEILTEAEFGKIITGIEKFEDLMNTAHTRLLNNYEYQFEEETLAEDARANEWDFDEDGNIT